MTNAKINLPYGIDDFEKVRESGCYYIDKTGFLRELLSETFSVNLITRPRRFGKTLIMSMLAAFFDIRKDSKRLFDGLEIAGEKELCAVWMNQWPVLFLTLKDIEGETFEDAYDMLQFFVSSLCDEHRYLLDGEQVSETDKERFLRLLAQEGDKTEIKTALFVLMRMMKAYYGKEVILLIDEYDVPLAKASDNGYYQEMLDVIRKFLGMVWKTNPSLKFALVTGCLRIAKESIFTGANNFLSNSILDVSYQDYFGFTEAEVSMLLKDAGAADALPEMKKWYDGYLFGEREVYCPWDVINHARALMKKRDAKPGNYWLDTSHNNIIRRFIDLPEVNVNHKFEILLAGGVIQEPIREDLTYDLAHSSEANLWSILYLTGYLTAVQPDRLPDGMEAEEGKTALRIPNEEIKSVFGDTVKKWFADRMETTDRKAFFEEWWNGEDAKLTKDVTDILFDTISYFDYREDFYHAFVAGLFSGAGYDVRSNSEQGTGRADVIVRDRRHRRVLVIEVKWSKENGVLEKECEEALEQIRERQYTRRFQSEGYESILCYGTAFQGKNCLVKSAADGRKGV